MFDVLRESEVVGPRCTLEEEYGSALVLDPERIAVNFVSTLDGLVSFGQAAGDSRAVGGGVAADRLVMAMLRAVSGVIVVGAGTLRATLTHQWTGAALLPGRDAALAELRAAAGRPASPAPLLVVSRSGRIPADAEAIAHPAVPVHLLTAGGTTAAGDGAPEGPSGALDPVSIVAAARRLAGRGPVLCEGGPSLFGGLLGGGVPVDLFVTIAPQLAGRDVSTPQRLNLVEGVALAPFSRRGTLRSVRAAGDHLLLRYEIDATYG